MHVPAKQQLNVRISDLHRGWLDQMCTAWNINEGELIQILIDRAWREYAQAQGLGVFETPPRPSATAPGGPGANG